MLKKFSDQLRQPEMTIKTHKVISLKSKCPMIFDHQFFLHMTTKESFLYMQPVVPIPLNAEHQVRKLDLPL